MQSVELFQKLLDLSREERADDIAKVQGAGSHRDVLELVTQPTMMQFFGELSQVDRVAFIKAVAL